MDIHSQEACVLWLGGGWSPLSFPFQYSWQWPQEIFPNAALSWEASEISVAAAGPGGLLSSAPSDRWKDGGKGCEHKGLWSPCSESLRHTWAMQLYQYCY
jgi:hypothetical protein